MTKRKRFEELISSKKFKQYLNWIGLGLGFLGILFIVLKLRNYTGQINYSDFTLFTWLSIIGLAIIYCISCVLLAIAWHNILLFLDLKVRPSWSIQTYGVSQLAKYVPGNIFQFASRQAIGVSDGLPGLPLAKSIFWELLLIAISGVFFGILIIPNFWREFSQFTSIVIFLLFIIIFFSIAYFKKSPKIGIAVGLYLSFLVFSSIIFIVVLFIINSSELFGITPIVYIGGAYVFAWLVGLITPGAPAGAGIREMVLFAFLQSFISQQNLLFAIVIMRFITVGGDIIFYCVSLAMKRMGLEKAVMQ